MSGRRQREREHTGRRRGAVLRPTGLIVACGSLALLLPRLAVADSTQVSPRSVALQPLAARSPIRPGSVGVVATDVTRSETGVRVPLQSVGVDHSQAKFRVLSGNARLDVVQSQPVVEITGRGTAVLSSSDARKIAAESDVRVGEKTPLPWMIVDSLPQGTEMQLRTARPYLGLARAIQWDDASSYHVARFQVGLDAQEGPDGKLQEPVVAALSVSCDDVSPMRLSLDAIGPAGEQVVQVKCARSAQKDPQSQTLKVRLAEGELPYEFVIPRVPGAPQLTTSATRAAAFGVGTVMVTVRNAERDGTALAVESDTRVQLQATGAAIDPSVITIPAGSSEASAEIRSRGWGRVGLVAHSGVEQSVTPVQIEFHFPLEFVIATLLGGSAGGFLAGTRRKKRRVASRRRRVQLVGEGAIIGLVIVAALLVFPSVSTIPEWARSSVVGWLVASTLAGFVGSDLLERLAQRVFGKPFDGAADEPAKAR